MWTNTLITPNIAAAMIGAGIGCLRSVVATAKKETPLQTLLAILCGQMLAAAVAEHFAAAMGVWVAGLVGLICGAVGGYALDALTALTPKAVASIVSGALEKIGCKPIAHEAEANQNEDVK